MDLGLKGKRALVIGASRGLGYAVANTLAAEGCRVAINSRSTKKLTASAKEIAEANDIPVLALPADIGDADAPADLIAKTISALGGLDLLVTNAGGPPPGAFESFSDEDWAKGIDLSLMSHVRLIKAALPHLRESDSASVLTITSYSVKQPIPNLVLSNSIRAATVGLTKTLALELGNDGIRFNSILPGWTKTERVTELLTARAQANDTSLSEELSKQMEDCPLGRMAEPQEFANPAVFLLSPAASYITGVMLTVDGGMYKGTL
ncbi:MAG: SDR family oxidoreductase [Anaerolineae bacterium]|jgi:3-oxoacyl-[acyl-carrier protein] reductase|nr:SDR family oxidoreductase [Anaerolineae bacterium]MBT7073377.1 SDR family oxidoreductase [Anaerolineae bacterium]MBT7783129.1 SDR family oxidoreductase [Anaerolineae bacterium]